MVSNPFLSLEGAASGPSGRPQLRVRRLRLRLRRRCDPRWAGTYSRLRACGTTAADSPATRDDRHARLRLADARRAAAAPGPLPGTAGSGFPALTAAPPPDRAAHRGTTDREAYRSRVSFDSGSRPGPGPGRLPARCT